MSGRVLVVEDDKALSDLLKYNLEKEGYSVSVALDGEEALLMAEEAPPDMVVLVVEGSFPATDANNAFIVVAREQSLRAAKAAIAGGASDTADSSSRGPTGRPPTGPNAHPAASAPPLA